MQIYGARLAHTIRFYRTASRPPFSVRRSLYVFGQPDRMADGRGGGRNVRRERYTFVRICVRVTGARQRLFNTSRSKRILHNSLCQRAARTRARAREQWRIRSTFFHRRTPRRALDLAPLPARGAHGSISNVRLVGRNTIGAIPRISVRNLRTTDPFGPTFREANTNDGWPARSFVTNFPVLGASVSVRTNYPRRNFRFSRRGSNRRRPSNEQSNRTSRRDEANDVNKTRIG